MRVHTLTTAIIIGCIGFGCGDDAAAETDSGQDAGTADASDATDATAPDTGVRDSGTDSGTVGECDPICPPHAPVCDGGACVECLTDADCVEHSSIGRTCDTSTHTCQQTSCSPDNNGFDCTRPSPACSDRQPDGTFQCGRWDGCDLDDSPEWPPGFGKTDDGPLAASDATPYDGNVTTINGFICPAPIRFEDFVESDWFRVSSRSGEEWRITLQGENVTLDVLSADNEMLGAGPDPVMLSGLAAGDFFVRVEISATDGGGMPLPTEQSIEYELTIEKTAGDTVPAPPPNIPAGACGVPTDTLRTSALPDTCLPRCAASLQPAFEACGTDAGCIRTTLEADTTPPVLYDELGLNNPWMLTPLNCLGCVVNQDKSCVTQNCLREYLALIQCVNPPTGQPRPREECPDEDAAVMRCVDADTGFDACIEARVGMCFG